MSRSKRPLLMRRKATQSRCFGFMFAWSLKTLALKRGSVGRTSVRSPSRVVAARGVGRGARSMKASKSGSTPKLVRAEPKKTGVTSPARKRSRSKGLPAASSRSISSPSRATVSSPSTSVAASNGIRVVFGRVLPRLDCFS